MHNRIVRLATLLVIAALALLGCSLTDLVGRQQPTATPTRTPQPTFTPTPVTPDLSELPPVVQPTSPPVAEESASSDQPAAEPSPTPEPATPTPAATPFLVITGDVINLRGGPGTNYPAVGKAQAGQTFAVTGKNEAGDWWQACCIDEQLFWVAAQFTRLEGPAEAVQLAERIPPPPPTPRPRPTEVPQPTAPPQPTQPPAPQYVFSAAGVESRVNTNPIVTVWGRVFNQARTQAFDGYTIRILRGGSEVAKAVTSATISRGDPGLASEFIYNTKIEIRDFSDGPYVAQLLDGSGQPAGPDQQFQVAGDIRTFLITWTK